MRTQFKATLYEKANNGIFHRLATVHNFNAFAAFMAGCKVQYPLGVFVLYRIGPARIQPTSPLASVLFFKKHLGS